MLSLFKVGEGGNEDFRIDTGAWGLLGEAEGNKAEYGVDEREESLSVGSEFESRLRWYVRSAVPGEDVRDVGDVEKGVSISISCRAAVVEGTLHPHPLRRQ